MSGEVYNIAKRAVNAYINTGSIPQYVATQVERDVKQWMEKRLRAARAEAWAEGAQIGFHSTMEGFNGECKFDHCAPDDYPPTNPYSGEKWEVAAWVDPA